MATSRGEPSSDVQNHQGPREGGGPAGPKSSSRPAEERPPQSEKEGTATAYKNRERGSNYYSNQ